jgi:uncharacterized protein
MIVLLSPAKSLNEAPLEFEASVSEPRLTRETAALLKVMKRKKPKDLMALMDISQGLGELNRARFVGFDAQTPLPAAMMFDGDVYTGLRMRELDADGIAFAQDHIRILSGLYGLLRPMDMIRPYRLEMGTGLKTTKGDTLYEFWGPKIAKLLMDDLKALGDKTVVNLASIEYGRAAVNKNLKAEVIIPRFLELKDNQARTISFLAKKARGLMARYMIDHRLTRPEDLKGFDSEGYQYRADLSKGADWVFARPQPEAKG